jgi:glycosyltransferase involved in cell wall biosynthesis
VAAADLVICNTERLRESFCASYKALPAERFFTLTNGFDDVSDLSPPQDTGRRERVALHLGDIYGGRRIDTFCAALGRLWETGRLNESWRVLFLGGFDPGVAEEALRDLPKEARSRIRFEPRVGWRLGQQALRNADVLLLFQAGTGVQVPAKFYEYLQTGKPILAVAPRSATTDAVEATGAGLWVEPADPARIAEIFLRIVEFSPKDRAEVVRRWGDRYHYRALASHLAGRLRALTGGAGGFPESTRADRESEVERPAHLANNLPPSRASG